MSSYIFIKHWYQTTYCTTSATHQYYSTAGNSTKLRELDCKASARLSIGISIILKHALTNGMLLQEIPVPGFKYSFVLLCIFSDAKQTVASRHFIVKCGWQNVLVPLLKQVKVFFVMLLRSQLWGGVLSSSGITDGRAAAIANNQLSD